MALKVLRVAEPEALYRFKHGFRSLAAIRHPNLCPLYELLVEEGWWLVSMELVPGKELVEALRSGLPTGCMPPPGLVKDAFFQLASGLEALHQHGRLHRDMKPSNVLVTERGRVVLLDFGLVVELGPRGTFRSAGAGALGTPIYMSPEQGQGQELSPASDWYSLGVMLHEVLSGRLPHGTAGAWHPAGWPQGTVQSIASQMPEAPPELLRLCDRLLDPNPETRASGPEILACLSSEPRVPNLSSAVPVFVGRQEVLDSLDESLSASRRGAVAAFLHGSSGVGKTSAALRFLQQLESRSSPAVVLRSRCYPQESMPYKALDGLVDELSRHLRALPDEERMGFLPAGREELARLFPVLGRVPGMEERPGSPKEGALSPADFEDPQSVRRRGIAALRTLLSRLGRLRPLVLFVDDLQWGDLDSLYLLEELLAPPHSPRFLLLGCYREEERANSPFLNGLREAHRLWGRTRLLELGQLEPPEARELVLQLASKHLAEDEAWIDRVTAEAEGSVLLLTELVLVRAGTAEEEAPARAAAMAGEQELGRLIRARWRRLAPASQRLLELVAVAGRPLELTTARRALGPVNESLGLLLSERLVRRQAAAQEAVEVAHDRIREVLLGSLDEGALATTHARLATALEASGHAEPGDLARHLQGMHELERAAGYTVTAAERAEAALAFDRASNLYRSALELLPAEDGRRFQVEVKLGLALANAGRSRDAATALLRAVQDSGTIDPVELQRDAAEKLLISGHIDHGLSVLRHVLRTMGMQLEARPGRVLLSLWWWRLRLRLQGESWVERAQEDCDPELLRKTDICWSVAVGLCLVDVLRAAEFHARHLWLALQAGEPRRVARGLALEVFFSSVEGGDPRRAVARARAAAAKLPGEYASSLSELAVGMGACLRGEWSKARQQLEGAERMLRHQGAGVAWEMDACRCFRVQTLIYLGQWRQLRALLGDWLTTAEEQSDLFLEIHLRLWGRSLIFLMEDRPQRAEQEVLRAIERWSHDGYHYQHFAALWASVQAALYSEEPAQAWSLVQDGWPRLRRSMVQRLEMVLVQCHDLRGRAALAAAAAGQRGLLAQVDREAAAVAATNAPWGWGLAALLRAGSAAVRGAREASLAELSLAETACASSDMVLHAAVARRARGEIMRRSDLVAEADREMRLQGIQRPDRFAKVLAPGFSRAFLTRSIH